jgi:3-oxoacyl-[acyl-carrier-protein] synthase II
LAGRSGIAAIQRFDAAALGIPVGIAGEATSFDPADLFSPKERRHKDLVVLFALAAAGEALAAASLTGRLGERAGVSIGTGGGLQTLLEQHRRALERGFDRVSPYLPATFIPNIAAAEISIRHGIEGPSASPATACAASASAIADGVDWIRLGRADVVVAGGAEAAVMPLAVAGFAAARALSTRNDDPTRASRPFDRDRDGFVIGEGAAALVLESEEHAVRRGARVLAEVAGYGITTDAHHITAPRPDGSGAAAAMRLALADADADAADVGYVNAHGTATLANDRTEAMAIRTALGTDSTALVASTKSMTGHMIGAAGAFEALVCVLALANGVIPPSVNLDHPDPECCLHFVPAEATAATPAAALSNSFAFGGHNVSLCFRRAR